MNQERRDLDVLEQLDALHAEIERRWGGDPAKSSTDGDKPAVDPRSENPNREATALSPE